MLCNKKIVVYFSNFLPYKLYEDLILKTKKVFSPPSQKFHSSIINGLINQGHKVILCSFNQFDYRIKNNTESYFFPYPKSTFISKVAFTINIFITLIHIRIKYKNVIFICDSLLAPLYKVSYLFSRLFRIKYVIIATDINEILFEDYNLSNQRINMILSDAYIFVAEKMNLLLNNRNKPYIVLDGLWENNSSSNKSNYSKKSNIILYAGNLDKIYGIPSLVEAFDSQSISHFELHIYGVGDYTKELIQICKTNPSIKFFGYKEHKYVIEKEKEAFLLVNPRPNDAIYNNYSFPSKVYEYMSSGTVLLTSKLPSFPKGFEDYVYYFDTNKSNDLLEKIKEIVSLDKKILEKKANSAYKFVSKEKDFITQTKKISMLLESL
jgi:hypothetical protein